MNVDVGDTAPDFTLRDQNGDEVTLSSLRGAPVLLYFYPKDETPGCTTQACDIRDRWSEFGDLDVTVLGISPDSVDSHASFVQNHDLPHTLLADPDKEVMTTYGAWGPKKLYGKETIGVTRSSVLVDAEGTVVKVWKQVQAKKHADYALAAARDLLG